MELIKTISSFIKKNFFFFTIILMVISFPLSESLLSISAGLIMIQLLFTGNWKFKIEKLKRDKAMWALAAVFFIYLIGSAFCKEKAIGLYELQKNIFWLLIPVGVALSVKLTHKQFWIIITFFLAAVFVGTVYATVQIVFDNLFQLFDFRDASIVSHLAFSLQIVFSIFIILYASIKKPPVLGRINQYILYVFCLWLFIFLGFQKSLTGIIALYGVGIFSIYWFINFMKNKIRKQYAYTFLYLFLIIPVLYIAGTVYFFYNTENETPTGNELTEQGNPYYFNFQNKQKENGNYVHWYISKIELEKEWNRVSDIKLYEKDATDYKVYYTLIRYMTSKGLTKDSAGVVSLTADDIRNVQNGVSNHIYVSRKYSIYPRIYQTIWELDEYFRTGNPNNQSLSQRIEYIKAALYIMKNNLWGIGTGNFRIAYEDAYNEIDTKLNEDLMLNVHNQYLSYMVKFGVLGFMLIFFLIGYAIIKRKQHRNFLLIILLIIIGLANMSETTLETHIGLPFFLLFLCLFLWHWSLNTTKSSEIK